MANMIVRCRACGAEISISVGQTLRKGMLIWHRASVCPSCGSQIEEDGRGDAPDDVRLAILHEDGEWTLIIESEVDLAVAGLKALRQAMDIPLGEVRRRWDCIRNGTMTGTRAEMEWLAAILRNENIFARVCRIPLTLTT